jgi:hypothetical protein
LAKQGLFFLMWGASIHGVSTQRKDAFMRRAILGTLFVPLISTTAAFAQEGFVLQEKPSAQCSIHLCDSINGPSYAEDGSIIRPIG